MEGKSLEREFNLMDLSASGWKNVNSSSSHSTTVEVKAEFSLEKL